MGSATSSDMSGTRAGPLGNFEPEVCFVLHKDSLRLKNVDLSEVYIPPVTMRWMRRRSFPTTLALDPALEDAYHSNRVEVDYLTCRDVWRGWINHVNPLVECNSTHHEDLADKKQ